MSIKDRLRHFHVTNCTINAKQFLDLLRQAKNTRFSNGIYNFIEKRSSLKRSETKLLTESFLYVCKRTWRYHLQFI